ncbi:MAG: hypothetical protein CTR54_11485 [Rhizobium sp.]|nr:MAG: hypothetical protein CTR54_11485 [Rhizobium sp.]
MPDHSPRSRPPLWRRLGPAERAVALAIVVVAIGGLLLIADGLYIKARATDSLPSRTAACIQSPIPAALDSGSCAADATITFPPSPLANPASLPR